MARTKTEQIEVHYRRSFEVTRTIERNFRIVRFASKSTNKKKEPPSGRVRFSKNLQIQIRYSRQSSKEIENAITH